MDFSTLLRAARSAGVKAAFSKSPFSLSPVSPLGLTMTMAGAVPKDDAASLDSRHRHGEIVRKAIMDSVNGQPAPGKELGAGLPSVPTAIHNGLDWLHNHAEPNLPAAAAPAPVAPVASQTPVPPGLFPSYFTPSKYSVPIPGMSNAPATPPAAPATGGGIGSDHSNIPWQIAAPPAPPAPAPVPLPPPRPMAAGGAPTLPPNTSPFFGSGFGAGENSAFMSPANMGQGSTLPGQVGSPLNGSGLPRVFASPADQKMLAGNPTADQVMDAYKRVGGGSDVSGTWPVQLSQGTSPFSFLAKLFNS